MKFTEFKVRQELEASSYQLQEAEIVEYATRFDPQPFHVDQEAAKDSPWRGIIASGSHTCAIAMRLTAGRPSQRPAESRLWLRPNRRATSRAVISGRADSQFPRAVQDKPAGRQ